VKAGGKFITGIGLAAVSIDAIDDATGHWGAGLVYPK
jgi:hypothetical protein